MIHQPNKKEGVFYGQQHSCGSVRSVKCCDSDRNDIRRRKVEKRINKNKLTVFSHKRMLINNLVKDKKEDMYMKKIILLFAAAVIFSSIGHQISGGYKDPEKERRKPFHSFRWFSRS